MNFTKEVMEKRILGAIRKNDKDLMAAIQDNMFVFDNLGMSDDKALQVLLRSFEVEDLCLAMKGADEELQGKLYSCMSERAAANLKDEMEAGACAAVKSKRLKNVSSRWHVAFPMRGYSPCWSRW